MEADEKIAGEKILSFGLSRMIEKAKFTYYPHGKAFEKQTKTIKNREREQVDTLQHLNPNHQLKSIEHLFSKNISNK